MIELSDQTKRLIDAVIPEPDRERIARRMREEVSENIPFMEDSDPMGMERIRFSVLRLIAEADMTEDQAIELAAIDWRDLFMAAGHGEDIGAHATWAQRMIDEGEGKAGG